MLKKIVDNKRREVKCESENLPLSKLVNNVTVGNFAFSSALRQNEWSLIAECKLASPVKGMLSDLSIGDLAQIYQDNGANALSVLTDIHFYGVLEHIRAAKEKTKLPVIRKDFIIDKYQLYQARAVGADAVLLIAAILTDSQLNEMLATATELGLDCLVEVHSREELDRVQQTRAQIIGINNRDLKTFTTSVENTFELLPYCEPGRLIISESGIQSREDVTRLKAVGVNGVLVGEGLVKAPDIPRKVQELSLRSREEIGYAK